MSTKKSCLNIAMGKLGAAEHLSREDIHQYASTASERVKYGENKEAVIKSLNKDFVFKSAREAANLVKTNKIITKMKKDGLSFRDFLDINTKNPVENTTQYIAHAKADLYEAFMGRLSPEEEALFTSPDGFAQIGAALDGVEASAEAKSLATKWHAYNKYRTDEMLKSGALRDEEVLKGRLFKTSHNLKKLTGGKLFSRTDPVDLNRFKNEWIKDVSGWLDKAKTFRGDKDEAAILGEAYDQITAIAVDSNRAFKRGDPRLKSRGLHFKDARSELAYQAKYGHDSFGTIALDDMNSSGHSIGISQLLGSNISKAYDVLTHAQIKLHPKTGRLWMSNTKNMYNIATRTEQGAVSPRFAELSQSLRNITSVSKLPAIVVQSLSDWAHTAAYAKRWGFGGLDAACKGVTNLFNGVSEKDKELLGNKLKSLIDPHLAYVARFAEGASLSPIDRGTNTLFKYYGLNRFDSGNKFAIMNAVAKGLGAVSHLKFDKIPLETKLQIEKYLTSDEWDLLRGKTSNGYFTMDNAIDESPALQRKVFALFNTAAFNTVLSPSTFEKAFMYYGTRPGTFPGEFLRSVMQFKGFALAYARRVLYEGYKDATAAQMRVRWASSILAGSFALSYASDSINDLIHGKTPQSLLDMSPQDFGEVLAAPLSVFLSTLSAQNQNKNLLLKLGSTPSINILSNAISVPFSAATGNFKQTASNLGQIGQSIIPSTNIPIIGAFIQDAFDIKPFLKEGQEKYL